MWRQALSQLKDVMSAAEPGYFIAPVFFVAASLILACAEPATEAPARAPTAETDVATKKEHTKIVPNVQTPLKSVQPAGTSGMTLRIRNSSTGYAITANVKFRHVKVGRTGSIVDLSPPSYMDSDKFGRAQLSLPPGEYLIEVSAPGYKSMSSHFPVEAGKPPLPITFEMEPVSKPEGLRPEVMAAQKRPGHCLILGYVVGAPNWQPLSGVQVQVSEARAMTDEKGYFMLSVPVPPLQSGDVRKDVVFERSGYKQYVLRNVSLWEGGDEITRIDMEPGEGTTSLGSLPK